jgi:hypothetical protein
MWSEFEPYEQVGRPYGRVPDAVGGQAQRPPADDAIDPPRRSGGLSGDLVTFASLGSASVPEVMSAELHG